MFRQIPLLLTLILLLAGQAACAGESLPRSRPTIIAVFSEPAHAPTSTALPLSTPAAAPIAASVRLIAETCLNNTQDEAICKDCCDSLDASGEIRKTCRDACPGHDFAKNMDFIVVEAPSVLGPDGDYAACTSLGGEQSCKACCDGSSNLQSGDRQFCRNACVKSPKNEQQPGGQLGQGTQPPKGGPAGRTPPPEAIVACKGKSEQTACEFTAQRGTESGVCETVQAQLACSPKHGPADPRPPDQPGNQTGEGQPGAGSTAYNIDQAISDKAQGMTIAFDALAFMTGDLGSDSFFPPGKVADFWGFQYLRDNDPSQMGHAGDFLTSAAMNVLNTLTADQRAKLVALAKSQVSSINEYGTKRFVLMEAFRRVLEGNLPVGTKGLSEDAVKAYSADLYRLDGEVSFARAQLMGSLIASLDASQRAHLDGMAAKGMREWPTVEEPTDLKNLDRDVKVAVMTYAADLFSWYAGSIDADTYFCPERHGTYFGSFYLKDRPAMDNSGYAIPTDMTGNMGDAMLQTLTPDQAQLVTGLVDIQRPALASIVEVRKQVSAELRKFKAGGAADRATVASLMGKYGELDGSIVYNLAEHFALVYQTLTTAQKTQLLALRNKMLGDLMHPSGAYMYSQPIPMPEIPNTDFLFK